MEMTINHSFTCHELAAKLSYDVCLRRQSTMMLANSKSRNPRYPVCHYCEQGKKIMAKFPGWKHVKKVHKGKPDRIKLKKDKKSGSRAACLKAIDLKPETKGAEMIPKRPIGRWNQKNNAEKHCSAPNSPLSF